MGLVEAALSEQPDDPSARELYAVTHLARAIRLSDKAREARRTGLRRGETTSDRRFQAALEVAATSTRATAAIKAFWPSIRRTGRRGCPRAGWFSLRTPAPGRPRPSRSSASSPPPIRRT